MPEGSQTSLASARNGISCSATAVMSSGSPRCWPSSSPSRSVLQAKWDMAPSSSRSRSSTRAAALAARVMTSQRPGGASAAGTPAHTVTTRTCSSSPRHS